MAGYSSHIAVTVLLATGAGALAQASPGRTDSNRTDPWRNNRRPMQRNVTVFGFGRGPSTTKQMTVVPSRFTIGLADGAQLSSAGKLIEASYRPVAVTISPLSTRERTYR